MNLLKYCAPAFYLMMFLCMPLRASAYDDQIYTEQSLKMRIARTAINTGLDPALALSVAKQESAFDKDAKSYVGAVGLFQLMPQTADNLGVNPYYVDQNIKGGIQYLKSLKDQFGSTPLALAAYNAGPGAVSKFGGVPPYSETQHYVKNIMHYYHHYKKNPDPVITYFGKRTNDNKNSVIANADTQSSVAKQDQKAQQPSDNFFTRLISFLIP